MTKTIALSIVIVLSIVTGCAARQTPAQPSAQQGVIGIEIRSLPDFQLVDDLEFDAPVTVERGPCRASQDCLIWYQGTEKFTREMRDDWSVAYRFVPTVTDLR